MTHTYTYMYTHGFAFHGSMHVFVQADDTMVHTLQESAGNCMYMRYEHMISTHDTIVDVFVHTCTHRNMCLRICKAVWRVTSHVCAWVWHSYMLCKTWQRKYRQIFCEKGNTHIHIDGMGYHHMYTQAHSNITCSVMWLIIIHLHTSDVQLHAYTTCFKSKTHIT